MSLLCFGDGATLLIQSAGARLRSKARLVGGYEWPTAVAP